MSRMFEATSPRNVTLLFNDIINNLYDADNDDKDDVDDTLLSTGKWIQGSKGRSRLRSARSGGFPSPPQPV